MSSIPQPEIELIHADWDAPHFVSAFTTTRIGGESQGPYKGLNLGLHVGDEAIVVEANRTNLANFSHMPHAPKWLNQTHSTEVATLLNGELDTQNADAVYTSQARQVCAILTADCLPVLFFSEKTHEIAAAHAGWRGLCAGILEATISKFTALPEDISVWLGPAIGPNTFEVGNDVFTAFTQNNSHAFTAFLPISSIKKANGDSEQKYLMDIYALAKQRMNKIGINRIFGGNLCTVTDKERFYSYRRDGVTGRLATCIWIDS